MFLTATISKENIQRLIEDFDIGDYRLITTNKKLTIPENISITDNISADYVELKARLFDYLLEQDNLPTIVYCTTIACCNTTACYIRRSFNYYREENKRIPAASVGCLIEVCSKPQSKKKNNTPNEFFKLLHSKLTDKEKKHVLENFEDGTTKIINATTSLGMGVNMKNIKSVIHYGLPRSITEYVQKIGRCGRGGQLGNGVSLRAETGVNKYCYR